MRAIHLLRRIPLPLVAAAGLSLFAMLAIGGSSTDNAYRASKDVVLPPIYISATPDRRDTGILQPAVAVRTIASQVDSGWRKGHWSRDKGPVQQGES